MTGYSLSHPVYLDLPMMLSFLAALEGGVIVAEDKTETASETSLRAASATAGLRARLLAVGSANMSGSGSLNQSETNSAVSQIQRQHTAASLFNALLATLREDGQIADLQESKQLSSLRVGDMVEIDGAFRGNPLEDILAFFAMVLPYVEPEATAKANPKSGNPAQRAAAQKPAAESGIGHDVIRMFHLMAKDIAESPVHDLLFQTESGLPVIVTASTEFYEPATVEYLRQGTFRVVGKVTRVLGGDDAINLARRTVLGLASPDVAGGLVDAARAMEDVNLQVADAIVTGPAIQILPLSIYI